MKRTHGKKGRIFGSTVDQEVLAEVQALLGDEPRTRDMLIEHLHKIQDHFHHISNRHILALAMVMNLPRAEVYETATFYHHFDVIQETEIPPPPLTIRVCDSITCEMFGARQLLDELLSSKNANVRIQAVPCVGRCNGAPVAVVGTNPVEHADKDKVRSAICNNETSAVLPDSITYNQYRKDGGYQTLIDCVNGKHERNDIINLLEDSSLRGLGGAGFPVGKKWRILSTQTQPRLIAINIDEGEPGTFKHSHYL